MITALSMISIVVESTILHRVGISSLTKTRPRTEDLDRNGSMYVDFPKVAMISEFGPIRLPLGLMVTGLRPMPDAGMES